jgi:electron transport complex protein RnfA
MEIINIIILALIVNNVVLAQFLGICPFLGVSNKVSTASGMGAAVVFVMALANLVTYFIYNYVLVPLGIEFMQTITFIFVIAFLVQVVEIVLKKTAPSLYQALGIYLPLITTNCAVLGIAILAIQKNYNLLESVIYASSTALGFTLAMIIMAGLREQVELSNIPKGMKGFPLSLILAGLLSLAFMGFAGMA